QGAGLNQRKMPSARVSYAGGSCRLVQLPAGSTFVASQAGARTSNNTVMAPRSIGAKRVPMPAPRHLAKRFECPNRRSARQSEPCKYPLAALLKYTVNRVLRSPAERHPRESDSKYRDKIFADLRRDGPGPLIWQGGWPPDWQSIADVEI